MRIGLTDDAARDLSALWDAGAAGSRTDRELLARYAGRSDAGAEAAFSAIVGRHGPLVMRTCRRVLGNRHDAEDAFQATFLVLARKAGSVRVGPTLAPWLHEVARRVAMEARGAAARRRAKEDPKADPHALPAWDDPVDDVGAVLDEELARLPEGFRAAVVLCDLEGLTIEAAAGRTGWPVGTVKSRLTRGRERLRRRLAGRGLAPARFEPADSRATVPAAWLGAASRGALSVNAGGSAAGAVPVAVASLAEGVITAMRLTTIRTAAATLAALALGAGVGAFAYQSVEYLPPKPQAGAAAANRPIPSPAAVEAANKALQSKLDAPVALSFPETMNLETALKTIKKATSGPNDPGVPIYVDPVGLNDAKAWPDMSVTVEGADRKRTLGETLGALLRPLHLDYSVRNGLLTISSKEETLGWEVGRLKQQVRELTERLESVERRSKPGT